MTAQAHIATMTEKSAGSFLLYQNRIKGTRDYGGLISPGRGYCEPSQTASAVDTLIALRILGESRYEPKELEDSASLYLDHLLSCQHPDGTIDLRETNFHCTATLSFGLQFLADTYRLLKSTDGAFAAESAEKLSTYIRRGIAALQDSGFHTPNHRWVIASAISHVLQLSEKSLLPVTDSERQGLQAELDRYLGEGIDMDEFGEYTEKSTGIYNVACNDSLLIIARSPKHRNLLPLVKRNIDLMPSYIEPDGSLFTMKSTRQDSGMKYYPDRYYANYLEYGHLAKDEEYRAYGAQLFWDGIKRGSNDSHHLLAKSLLYPELLEGLPEGKQLESTQKYFNPQFGLFRTRQDTHSATASAGSTKFLKYQKGANSVILRIATTFFGRRGRFIPETIEQPASDVARLSQSTEWGYVKPFADAPSSPMWAEMDHHSRERAYMQKLQIGVDISMAGATELQLAVDGPEGMLYRIELIFPAGGQFETDSMVISGEAGTGLSLKDETCTYRLGTDVITVTGGFSEHLCGPSLRGGEEQERDAFTVYCNGYAPDKRVIVLS